MDDLGRRRVIRRTFYVDSGPRAREEERNSLRINVSQRGRVLMAITLEGGCVRRAFCDFYRQFRLDASGRLRISRRLIVTQASAISFLSRVPRTTYRRRLRL